MQLRHRDNLVNGFFTSNRAYITALVPSALVLWFVCTCACAKPIPEIVPMVKLDIWCILNALICIQLLNALICIQLLNALICIQLLNAYEMHLFHVKCIINTKQIDVNWGNSEVLTFHKIRASKYKLWNP